MQYTTNIHVLAAFEAHVPGSCNCWLSPECVGQDWANHHPLHPPHAQLSTKVPHFLSISSAMDATSPPSPTTSLPYDQQLVPASTPHGSSGSIGPFFAVMSVIIILSALSCIFGRYCASWSQGPDAWYDCLGWARRRCGGGGQCALGCCIGREVPSAVAVDLHSKIRESKQLPLSSPQQREPADP